MGIEQAPKSKEQYKPSEEEREEMDKNIEEHNEEIRKRKESTEDKPAEKPKGAERPSPEINFGNNPNKEDFKKLAGGIKEKVASVYEGIKVKLIDRAKVMYNTELYDLYQESVAAISNKINTQDNKIKEIEAKIEVHGIRMEGLKKQFGELEPKAQKEADKEKQKLEKELLIAEGEKTQLLFWGSDIEAKRNKYEEKRQKILEKVEKFVEEKTAPYDEKIESLRDERGKLDVEIGDLTEKRNTSQDSLNKLEEMAENAKFKFEKITYRNKIKEAKVELRETEQGIYSLQRDQMEMNGKISGLHGKISHWNGVRDKMMGLSESKKEDKNETSIPEVPEKETVNTDPGSETEAWYEANNLSNEDMNNVVNFEESEGLKEISSEDYIKKWNRMFDKSLHVDKAVFSEILKKKDKYNSLSDILVVRKIEGIVEEYNDKLPKKKKIEWQSLNRMFDKMREEEDSLKQVA